MSATQNRAESKESHSQPRVADHLLALSLQREGEGRGGPLDALSEHATLEQRVRLGKVTRD